MKNFAKLFQTSIGQIVAMRQPGDAGPEVALYFKPEELDTCMLSVGFEDSEEGEAKADAALDRLDEESAADLVLKHMRALFPKIEVQQ